MSSEPRPASPAPRLATRAELAEAFGVSVSTLERLWAQRESNGHPAPADAVSGGPGPARPRWHVSTWGTWYEHYRAQQKERGPRAGGPNDFGGPADFARACGHADTSTISHWLNEPPPGFPAPDEWISLPSGRRRPQWRFRRMWDFADDRPGRGRRAGRRPGSRKGDQPYVGDPRLDLARQVLSDDPEAANADLIRQLQSVADPALASSRSTWNRILNAARNSPSETQ
ncbi:hypothetical protein [Streptomyces sp. NPDC049881]|uniref:hypothetical protein n=1 Tax=Streptomyces sp. NPDC049881 TaxID=3155778 RepID=UPI0034260C6C